jgi:uncharacterized membrane protein (Fun14 family)
MSDDVSGRNNRFSHAVAELPSWKKRLLSLTLVAALLGGGARLATMAAAKPRVEASPTTTPVVVNEAMPSGSSGFVNARATASSEAAIDAPVQTDAPEPSRTEFYSGWVFRIGLSIFIGIVIGTVFRMFIKTMAVLTAVVVTAIVVLSYFKVINIDFTTMKDNYESFAGWAQGQVGRLKDVVMASLPSTTSAAVGFFLGFKR